MTQRRASTPLRIAAACALFGLTACASSGPDNDPLEGMNRAVFSFNRGVDQVVLRPVSVAYREVTPEPIRDRVRDVLNHLKSPVDLANNLMQGDLDGAELTVRRFFINTILGAGGLVDVAGSIGAERRPEDFGQTLGVWGVDTGPYLVLPLLGPSNARDTVGLAVDYFIDPVRYYLQIEKDWPEGQWIRTGADAVDGRERADKTLKELERDTVDLYARVRSAYTQRRAAEVRNGKPAVTAASDEPAFPGQVVKK